MKIYVVTSGSYSDYHINKVFTDKDKAYEYAEWHNHWDGTDVEEYETEDDFVVDKYYIIRITMKIYKDKMLGPVVRVQKKDELEHHNWFYNRGDHFELTIVRSVPYENWNKEFYVNKYTKAIYDLSTIVKYHMEIGVNDRDIQTLIRGYSEEE